MNASWLLHPPRIYFTKRENNNKFLRIFQIPKCVLISRQNLRVLFDTKMEMINYMSFYIPKIWQILLCFIGTFHQAWTFHFWRVESKSALSYIAKYVYFFDILHPKIYYKIIVRLAFSFKGSLCHLKFASGSKIYYNYSLAMSINYFEF